MTFDEIVEEVMDRLNLTSEDARTRIERRVNDRYRRVTSAIGLQTSRRLVQDIEYDPTDVDSELPLITVAGIQKVHNIKIEDDDGGVTLLKEITFDDMTSKPTNSAQPRAWAYKLIGNDEVVLQLDAYPTTAFTLKIEGHENAIDLVGDLEPYFPEDFHDILVEGAMSDELRKMEKMQLAQIAESNYERRLSDLRMFIAKSAYLDIYQGKNKPNRYWLGQWMNRTTIS